jgi:NDP-sugar pyrophosphorylase family protein
MQCLILAGGLGTRMRPLTGDLPKALLPVRGRPFAEWQLDWLKAGGVGRVVFAVGHQGRMVRDAIGAGDRFGLDIAYSDEGERLLGTAGAVRLAVDAGLLEDRFFVLYGDSYLAIDPRAVWRAAAADERPLLCVHKNDGKWDASNAAFADGMVGRFEKGVKDAAARGLRYIDYGLAVLSRRLIETEVPAGGRHDLADLYRRLAAAGRLRGFEAPERFYEIGSPQGLNDLEEHLAGKAGGTAG